MVDSPLMLLGVGVASGVVAWMAQQRSRNGWALLAIGVIAFVAGSAIAGWALPPTELADGETPSAAYTLWSDSELRADAGLALLIVVVGIAIAWLIDRAMRVATNPSAGALLRDPRMLANAIGSAALLTVPVIAWVGVTVWMAVEADYREAILPTVGFFAVALISGALWAIFDEEFRRNLALVGFALILLIAQLRFNATRPPGSLFESNGSVPAFMPLIPFFIGLGVAPMLRWARQSKQYVLMAWRLGLLAWLVALIGFVVKFMGYYDYQNAFAFDIASALDAPIRLLVALTGIYYSVVPREVTAERNVADMENWRTGLMILSGLGAWLAAVITVWSNRITLDNARHLDLSIQQKRYLLAYALVFPALALRTFTTFYPFIQTVILSVQKYNPAFPPRTYREFGNFERLSTDLVVRESLEFTLLFVFVSTFFQMALGLAIAHLLNANFRLRGLARTISLIPWAVPMVVAAIGFRWMFDDTFGMIPDLLRRTVGYEGKWLVDPENARVAVTFVNVWKSTPFAALLLLAGLQGINEDLYEAARVDGANWLDSLRFITVPMLLPIIVTVSMFLVIWQLAVFDLPFAMTGGAPGFATTVIGQKIYLEINSLNYSFAAAVSIFLVVIVTLIGALGVYTLRRVEVQA